MMASPLKFHDKSFFYVENFMVLGLIEKYCRLKEQYDGFLDQFFISDDDRYTMYMLIVTKCIIHPIFMSMLLYYCLFEKNWF